MNSPYLDAPPAQYLISLTRDADAVFTLNRTDSSGNNLAWNSVVTIEFSVEGTPTTFTAFVNASQALFTIPAATANQLHTNSRWRILMTTSAPTITTPVAVGTFLREDGGPTYPSGQQFTCGRVDTKYRPQQQVKLSDVRAKLEAGERVTAEEWQQLADHNKYEAARYKHLVEGPS
jgi:hypothetical protein